MRLARAASLGYAAALLWGHAAAQSVAISDTSALSFFTGTRVRTSKPTEPPSSVYVTYKSKITLTGIESASATGTLGEGLSSTGSIVTTTMTTATNVTSESTTPTTSTSSSAEPTNTQPCNGHVEFCTRKYSNITEVGCHNSPFVRPGNSGSNQELPVKTQLDDGIRFLQAQIQFPINGSVPHFCHTSCDLLDAGPITDWLGQVTEWVAAHPYDVVTIMLGNGNYSDPSLYAPYIEQSGIVNYAYQAPFLPMALDDWPTLEYLIVRGKRVVMFLDYQANQTEYPWLLDEFSQMWETQFDPTDRNFPCDVHRPPDLSPEATRDRLYILNHNLNAEFNVFSTQLLVPAVSLLNETNAAEGYGSLGLSANNCRSDWGRAPNVLNVDYYNYGSPPGSVFEAAARINNVTYDNNCCGQVSAANVLGTAGAWVLLAPLLLGSFILWW